MYQEETKFSTKTNDISKCNVSYQRPVKVGHYSLDACKEKQTKKVLFDESKLSYLRIPKSGPILFDLTESYEKYSHIQWASTPNEKLDQFLHWIVNGNYVLSNNIHQPLGVDFLTYRGVLTKILVSPFVNDKWWIGATKFRGTIYLCLYPENKFQNNALNILSFGGYRFEHYITRSSPDETENSPFSPDRGEYSAVLKSKLESFDGKLSLMYAAEIDCLDEGRTNSSEMRNFVEIKTTKEMFSSYQYQNFFKWKLIKWWAQCYLVDVSKIICGYKTHDHVVNEIEEMDVDRIPQKCSQYWTRRQCLDFLHRFLRHVQKIVVDDDPKQLYLFTNDQPQAISCKKLFNPGPFEIIPDWYITGLQNKK